MQILYINQNPYIVIKPDPSYMSKKNGVLNYDENGLLVYTVTIGYDFRLMTVNNVVQDVSFRIYAKRGDYMNPNYAEFYFYDAYPPNVGVTSVQQTFTDTNVLKDYISGRIQDMFFLCCYFLFLKKNQSFHGYRKLIFRPSCTCFFSRAD